MKISFSRQLAYEVLTKVEQSGAFANLSLQQALRQTRLDVRDKALATEIIYGTVQRRRSLDELLQPYSKRKLTALDAPVLTLLRMTAYQLAFLDKVPPYAAINDAVELCKRAHPYSAGFVNGVLRAFNREQTEPQKRLEEIARQASSWADSLGILYSFPTWIVELLGRAYGEARAEKILKVSNDRSHLSVRVNCMRANREDVLALLSDELRQGAEWSKVSPDGLRFTRGFDVESWDAYQTGMVTVQDEAAMLIPPLLVPDGNRVILDMCAAPGTKTTQIAELQGDAGEITAVDLYPHKLELLQKAVKRLKLTSIETRSQDARDLAKEQSLYGKYDAILLDAPCTGLGVLRHRPDIRWKRQPKDIVSLQQLQKELLTTAANLVRPGGVIVYSTCTLTKEENEEVVEEVLKNESLGLVWDDLRPQLPVELRSQVANHHGGLLITPEMFNTDGFYMARLKKLR